ncbi:MAG: hypothetical protein BWX80_01281 [Candidatus Hydrogenedentes bacterium ADurb.Bin101]|nr:MAG: hypothetical protein BWX80_01281 [Candidatus Hydrogenedentes bacterium ADurb.Bin101]
MIGQADLAVPALGHPAAHRAEHHRGEAAAVQQQDDLLPGLNPLLNGFLQGRGQNNLPGGFHMLLTHVNQMHPGQCGGSGPAQQLEPGGLLIVAVIVRLQARRGRTQQTNRAVHARTDDSHVPGVVPGCIVLFIRGIMLLVHHDHAEVGKGREYGRAGTNYDAYLPLPRQAPGIIAFPIAQAAVQDGDILFEPCIKAAYRLGGQGNFGNQHDGGTVQGQYFFNSLQVDFRFTRTGNAVDEKGFISMVIQRPADSVQSVLLFRIQAELVFRKHVRLHLGPPVRFRLEACDQPLLFKRVKHRLVRTMLLVEAGCRLFLFAVEQVQIYGGATRRLALQSLQRVIVRNGRLHQANPGFH